MQTPLDSVEFLRAQERAAYERWRTTPGNAPELNERFKAWQRALALFDAEVLDRARRARSAA